MEGALRAGTNRSTTREANALNVTKNYKVKFQRYSEVKLWFVVGSFSILRSFTFDDIC